MPAKTYRSTFVAHSAAWRAIRRFKTHGVAGRHS
ncbi:hypothetical protein ABIE45_006288 [Methylobacterium sp. OAE515]